MTTSNETNFTGASKQWANRPADDRFWNISEMQAAMEARKNESREITANLDKVRVVDDNGDLLLNFGERSAVLGNLATEQLTRRVGFHPTALTLLSAGLAADVLNERIVATAKDATGKDRSIQALIRIGADGNANVRAVTSEKYSRIWDTQVVEIAKNLESLGFKVPPARPAGIANERTRIATEEDCGFGAGGGLAVKPGDTIAPAGLYSGDRDSFMLLVQPHGEDGGDGSEFMRAVMIQNSEVGTGSFKLTSAMLRAVCGNHILWGYTEIMNISRKHIGNVGEALTLAKSKLGEIAGRSMLPDLEVIKTLRTRTLGDNVADVAEKVYDLRLSQVLTQGLIAKAMASAEKWRDVDGDPLTAWGVVNGLTRVSQESGYADERLAIDMAAGKLMAVLSK
jgi:hypothetical protein